MNNDSVIFSFSIFRLYAWLNIFLYTISTFIDVNIEIRILIVYDVN